MSETFVNGHIALLIKAGSANSIATACTYRHYDVFVSLWSATEGGSDVNTVAAGAGVRVTLMH